MNPGSINAPVPNIDFWKAIKVVVSNDVATDVAVIAKELTIGGSFDRDVVQKELLPIIKSDEVWRSETQRLCSLSDRGVAECFDQHNVYIRDMAHVGFYRKKRIFRPDLIVCFCCGEGVSVKEKKWEGSTALSLHESLNKNCPYLFFVKRDALWDELFDAPELVPEQQGGASEVLGTCPHSSQDRQSVVGDSRDDDFSRRVLSKNATGNPWERSKQEIVEELQLDFHDVDQVLEGVVRYFDDQENPIKTRNKEELADLYFSQREVDQFNDNFSLPLANDGASGGNSGASVNIGGIDQQTDVKSGLGISVRDTGITEEDLLNGSGGAGYLPHSSIDSNGDSDGEFDISDPQKKRFFQLFKEKGESCNLGVIENVINRLKNKKTGSHEFTNDEFWTEYLNVHNM